MIIPWRVDVPQDRWPFANWLIIAGMIAVFALQVADYRAYTEQGRRNPPVEEVEKPEKPQGGTFDYVLDGWNIKGLFGYMWLHGGLFHLAGNLLFLWVFGNAVCSKVGNLIYLPLYILFGLAAAVLHLLFVGGAMVGASGAIFGVVGMYLVFFPENDITCYWMWLLFFGRSFTVSGYWMILLWLFFNVSGAFCSYTSEVTGGVAYFAHLGGFIAGFTTAIVMLKTKMITMEKYERSLLQIFRKKENNEDSLADRRYAGFEKELSEVAMEEKQKEKTLKLDEALRQFKEVEQKKEFPQPDSSSQDIIRFSCPCGKRVKISAKYAGKLATCPQCHKQVRIPQKPST